MLSAIIPTWCEASQIVPAVRGAQALADEVIVADAASPDGTAALALQAGARVVRAPKGRGAQLRSGAQAAAGDTLLFLHADARLPPGARRAIEEALQDPQVAGGNFRLRFTPHSPAARCFTVANDLRRRALRIYYGDSALFLRRAVYERLGGFRPLPLFEDYDLIRRLERSARTVYLRHVEVQVSARRFTGTPLRALGLWALLQGLYSAGVPAEWLSRLYRDLRPRGVGPCACC